MRKQTFSEPLCPFLAFERHSSLHPFLSGLPATLRLRKSCVSYLCWHSLVGHWIQKSLYTELWGINDLFTAVCETFPGWLALWHSPYKAYSLYFMWFHRGDESNKGQACHTISDIRQSTQPSALQAVSICSGCCQLLWHVGGERLLQYFYSIFLLLWILWTKEERGEERRRPVKHSVLLSTLTRLPH